MLSVFALEDNESIAVWLAPCSDGFELMLCDGSRVWRTEEPITAAAKPASRKHESDEDFMTQVKRALSKDELGSASNFEVDMKPGEDGLRITVKETIGTTSTKSILFKTTVPSFSVPEAGIMKLFSEVAAKMQRDAMHVATQNKSLSEYASLVETLTNNTKEMDTMKDRLQDEMISKMCMVLNSKKREIERLNERIAELESELSALGDSNAQPATAAPPAVRPIPPPKARAPRATKPKASAKAPAKAPAKTNAATGKPVPKRTAKKSGRSRLSSSSGEEDEDEVDESESESSEEEAIDLRSDGESSGAAMEGTDDDVVSVPMVTQSSAAHTLPSPASTLPSRSGIVSGVAKHVTLSAPVMDAVPEENESDEEILPSKRRKAAQQQVSQQTQAPLLATSSNSSGDCSSGVVRKAAVPSQSTGGGGGGGGGTGGGGGGKPGGQLSKFYAEDSDEDSGNCLAFM